MVMGITTTVTRTRRPDIIRKYAKARTCAMPPGAVGLRETRRKFRPVPTSVQAGEDIFKPVGGGTHHAFDQYLTAGQHHEN